MYNLFRDAYKDGLFGYSEVLLIQLAVQTLLDVGAQVLVVSVVLLAAAKVLECVDN